MVFGTSVFFGFVGFFAYFNPLFAVLYLVYPFFESALLLSAINWAWHCFLDPDADNDYASSITIFDGDERTNILNEDFHVVHHKYPGAHWALHPALCVAEIDSLGAFRQHCNYTLLFQIGTKSTKKSTSSTMPLFCETPMQWKSSSWPSSRSTTCLPKNGLILVAK